MWYVSTGRPCLNTIDRGIRAVRAIGRTDDNAMRGPAITERWRSVVTRRIVDRAGLPIEMVQRVGGEGDRRRRRHGIDEGDPYDDDADDDDKEEGATYMQGARVRIRWRCAGAPRFARERPGGIPRGSGGRMVRRGGGSFRRCMLRVRRWWGKWRFARAMRVPRRVDPARRDRVHGGGLRLGIIEGFAMTSCAGA